MNSLTQKSKFLSLLLRHKPETVGLELDKNGWADVSMLHMLAEISEHELREIVELDTKGRYEYNRNRTKIRACQGHSIKEVDLELKPTPLRTDQLYQGTVSKFIQSIIDTGLKPQKRNYVHLSEDVETAIEVGKRRGKPIIVVVDAWRMENDGIPFYLSNNGVWLIEYVDPKYFDSIIINP